MIRLDLPYRTPPLSMNDRGASMAAVRAKSAETAAIRRCAALLAHRAHIPQGAGHATVTLHYRPPDRRRRDTDNLTATAKPIYDGLVDYGLVPDDTPRYMAKPEPVIHAPSKSPEMWLEIECATEPKELPA